VWYDEKVDQILGNIVGNRVGIWGQHGSGKTFLLKKLRSKLDKSFYVHIHSFRMHLENFTGAYYLPIGNKQVT